jgi:hypothetical protein
VCVCVCVCALEVVFVLFGVDAEDNGGCENDDVGKCDENKAGGALDGLCECVCV